MDTTGEGRCGGVETGGIERWGKEGRAARTRQPGRVGSISDIGRGESGRAEGRTDDRSSSKMELGTLKRRNLNISPPLRPSLPFLSLSLIAWLFPPFPSLPPFHLSPPGPSLLPPPMRREREGGGMGKGGK